MQPLFFRNDVVLHNDGSMHRILQIVTEFDSRESHDIVQAHAWLIHLNDRLALPYRVLFERLIVEYRHPPAAKKEQPRKSTDLHQTSMAPLSADATPAMKDVGDRAFGRIAPLVNNPAIFSPGTRSVLLTERSQEIGGGTKKTLLSDLRRWWQGGQTLNALSGKYNACGKHEGTGNRGRKRKKKNDLISDEDPSLRPFQLGNSERKLMRSVIEEFYLMEGSKYTVASTLRELHSRHYSYVDGNGKTFLRHHTECPTYRQLDYFLKKTYPLAVRLEKRKGEKQFAQNDRSVEGSILRDCHGAAHIYEIDATIVDVVLVSARDPAVIVGKPTLYLIIDRYSRLIVGWYLGFENASYTAAMQALLSIGEDKEELCQRLDIPYDPNDWPAHGVLPEQFLADQGELTSQEARRIGRSLRSTIANVPGLRPDWKPLVECGFKLLHQIIAPDTPGYTADADARKRRAKNVDGEACMNIHQLERKLVLTMISQNKSLHKGYPLTVAQTADRVRPIPVELFDHSIRRRMGTLDRMDFERVREELLPRGTAVVRGDGIVFKKVHYSCPEARDRGWLVEGRKKRKPAEIAFDYRLVDEIIVYSPNGSESFIATLTKDSVKFEGMSFKEVHQYFADSDELKEDGLEINRQNRFELQMQTQLMVADAAKKTKAATKGVSRSSRRKDVAPARAIELRNERASSAGVRNIESNADIVEPPSALRDAQPASPSNVVPIGQKAQAEHPSGIERQPSTPNAGQSTPRAKTLAERLAALRQNL